MHSAQNGSHQHLSDHHRRALRFHPNSHRISRSFPFRFPIALTVAVVLSVIGGGLYNIGNPRDSIVQYDVVLKADKFLQIAHGTADEVDQAKEIIGHTSPVEVNVHAGETNQPAGAV